MTTYTKTIKRYRQSDKGKATQKAYRTTPEFKAKSVQKYHDPESWKRYTLSYIKYRAKIRNLPFDLELSDLTIPEICPVFGTPIKITYGRKALGSREAPSVDRIDNSKGYTKDNICVISNRANVLKKDGTLEEFEKIVKYLKEGV